MIKEYEKGDLDGFEPNSFSDPADVMFIFESDEWLKYTLMDEWVRCLICFKDNGDNDWAGFFLIAKNFRARHGRELRWFMEEMAVKLKPTFGSARLWTISRPCSVLKRWHEWIGMDIEKEYVIDDVKYNIWSRRY